jgi:hypothetical protein
MVYTTVNLREGPGTNYNIVGKIPAGSKIAVAGCKAQWCQVSWQGQGGFIIATSLAPSAPPRGYPPPPPPGYPPPPAYGGPPVYYGYGPGPCCYGGYYGPGPYWHRGWHRRW